jgi:hypothetical protein
LVHGIGHAFEQLHHGIGRSSLRADVVDGDDVGVGQGGDGARLFLEAPGELFVAREPLGKHLDRDLAAESRVARPIDLAHSSGAEQRQDLVRPKPRVRSHSHRVSLLPKLRVES